MLVKNSVLVKGTPALGESPAHRKCFSVPSLLPVGIHVRFILGPVDRCPWDRKSPKVKFWSCHVVVPSLAILSQESNFSSRET